MDPLSLIAGAAAAGAGAGAGWFRARQRAQSAEEELARARKQRDRAQHDALHDDLTGILNRRGWFAHAGVLAASPRHSAVVVVIDVDAFKQINDTYGHGAGDRVLTVTANRLRRFGQGNMTLSCRLGGDEFAAILMAPRSDDWGWLHPAAAALAHNLAAPVRAVGQSIPVTASIGLAPAHPRTTLDLLLNQADAALYRAKEHRTRAATYDPVLDAERLRTGLTGGRHQTHARSAA